jgi:hypothetical protein
MVQDSFDEPITPLLLLGRTAHNILVTPSGEV